MKQEETIHLKTDFVSIGGGGGGLSGALTTAKGGARVIVLEKLAAMGGSSSFAEGLFAAESNMQLERNIDITRDESFKNHMEFSSWRANARLVRAFIDKSANTIDWLQELGVEFIEPGSLYPGASRTWHTIKGFGAALVRTLREHLEAMENVQILKKTPAKKLVVENGRISGVIAKNSDGKTLHIETKTVLIADGGFANSKELLEKYTAAGPNLLPRGNMGKTGDGMLMAWEIGAAPHGTDVLQLITPGVKTEKGVTHLKAALCQPYLWINQMGERFCDEGLLRFPLVGNAQANQKNQIMFTVFDENTKKYLINEGVDYNMGMYIPPKTKLDKLEDSLKDGINDGEVFTADTIEELADKIEVASQELKATVEEYNQFCEQKHDALFTKKSKYLQPVTVPPFFAIRGYPSMTGTLGGIKINHKTEVLDKDFNIIPGLYAGGNCAGGLYGDTYDASAAGTALGFAVNSGRMAGENALKYIGK